MAATWVEQEPTLHRYFGPGHSGTNRLSTDVGHEYYFGGEERPISPEAEVRVVYRLTNGDTPEKIYGPNSPNGKFISSVGMNRSMQLALAGPITDYFVFVKE